jgi:hypothetical protein
VTRFVIVCVIACAGKPPAPVTPPAAVARCADLPCLEANNGSIVDLDGRFLGPTGNAKLSAQSWLQLADGTKVMLHGKGKPARTRDGEHMLLRVRIYTHDIPARYGIYQALNAPYAVEIY